MSETFLNSPGLLLDDLSKKMLYGLGHYPMLAIKHEKIEYFCDRFQQLFNGDYRPVKLQAAMLHSCILQYCECILVFVKDNSVSMKNDEVGFLRRWLSVLDNLGGVDSIKNKFIYFMPVIKYMIFKNIVSSWVVKEFMLHLNRLFEKSTQFIFNKKEKKFLFRTVENWLKLIMTCGDYEFQTILVEAIISTCELCHIQEILVRNFGEENVLTTMFLKVFGKQSYVNDLKTFLTAINDSFKQVRSVPCLKVTLEKTVIPPLTGTNGNETWMHINYGFQTLSFECQRDSLRSLPASINCFNSYEFVSVNFKDVDKVCLLRNNDSKTVNPVGGIFLIYLAGKCSCRFNSSQDIVWSIKKITFTVSDGSHLQYLKETFEKFFGRRFKVANRIPVKKRTFYDKRDSSLNSSTSNSSFRSEKRRRRRKKHTDSKSLESVFLTNLKLENSFTLENKENVPEGTQDCSLNSTDSLFKKPVLIDYKKISPTNRHTIKSVNNKENETVNLNDKMVACSSRNWLLVENDLEHSENHRLMFPDSITNKFMNPISKSKGRGGRGTTKNSFLSLFKSWDIVDTRTTSKNKEMLESSKIPSNYKFGDENSLVISEENKSSKVKTPKAKSSSTADSLDSLNDKIVKCSNRSWSSTENNLEHSESDCLIFPDTITNEFTKATENYSTNKANGNGERGTTKNNLSLLKSWDIDILTTSKNKELQESSKINFVATTEEITIPSNYTLVEENDLTISEENRSEIIDFINEELNSIPDLESPLDIKNESRKEKTPKAESSGIADTPASITTSNAKFQAKSSNEDRRLNVLPEITSKSKKNTSLAISKYSLKRLPKSRRKDTENRRTEKKESIDTSKTVGRLLRSSVKVNDTKSNPTNKSNSWGINALTTPKNKKMPVNSKISLEVSTTEAMAIPSNYKFDEENSLVILEENKVEILDFINEELHSIPDLQSPLDLKSKSSKVKISKAENSGIADSPVSLKNKIVKFSSRNRLSTENKLEHSDNDRLMFPDTITNEFMNATESYSTSKSKGKGTTENNLSLLDNKNMPESSKTSPVVATMEEMTIPSNYKFGEENSLSISKENESEIVDFINEELNSIPDLQSLLDLKYKSRKGKTLKAKNSGTADSPACRTTSNAKLKAKSSNEEMTLKSKKNTGLVISNNPLKRLPKSHKKDKEYRRTEKKESIDKSKTVGRLLRSSVKVESTKRNSEISLKNKRNENRKKSIKIEHSSSRGNTEEIGNVKVISKKKTKKHSSNDDHQIFRFLDFENLNRISKPSSLKKLSQNNTKKHLQDNSETPDIDLILAYSRKTEKNLDKEVIDDDESIISISSTEETNENGQYYDLTETTADAQKILIDIQVASENNKDKTSTLSTEGSISGTKLDKTTAKTKPYDVAKPNGDAQRDIPEKQKHTDDRATNSIPSDEATGINYSETSDNILSEHNYSLYYADIEETQILAINDKITNDHCYTSNPAPMHEMANETKNDELIRNYSETSDNILSEHNYSLAEKTETAVKYDDTDIEELQILATNDIITNDHQAPMQEMANETKNEEDCSPGSVDDISTPKELALLTDVPILLNKVDYREKASAIKSSKSTEELENSFHSMKSKSIKNGFVVRNKSKIASSFHTKTNRSHKDRQLLKEKYAAAYNELQESKNEVAKLYAELARKRQKVEELERINKKTLESTQTSKPDKTCRKKTVTSERKRTKEHITSQSEISTEKFQKSFEELIESPRNRLPDNSFLMDNEETGNFQKSLRMSDGGEFSKKRLSDISAASDAKKRNKEMLESTQTSKPDKTVTSERKQTEGHISSQSEISNAKFQKSFQEFIEAPLNRLPDSSFLMDNFQKSLKMSDCEEFSKTRLSDKTVTCDPEKRMKLVENVQLSRKIQKPKDDSFAKFTLETSPLQFNDPKIPTPTPQTHESKTVNEDLSFVPPLDSVKVKQLVKENKNIKFDFDDLKMDSGGLYNLVDKPHKLSEKSDKAGEDLNDPYGFDAIIIGLRAYLKTLKPPVERKKKPQKRRIIKIKWGGTKKAKSKSKKRNFGKLF